MLYNTYVRVNRRLTKVNILDKRDWLAVWAARWDGACALADKTAVVATQKNELLK